MKHPNILCFVTSQQRADHLGCYGNPDVQTPNIDRLAREGVAFRHAFVANPKSMPNRASLFTGLYPKVHSVCEDGIPLDPTLPLLPDLLRRAGYHTALFGKLHLAPYTADAGREMALHEIVETPEFWAEHAHLPTPHAGFETFI
ncbi:MAG: sulfatase-like hydrolase/transferase [Aggregatilineales bacterium]